MSTELTESEAERIGDAYDVGPASVIKVVTRIVKAREAAARQEALLEVRDAVQRRMDGAELADGGKLQTWDALASVMEWIEEKAALAEPERDEEGGR